MESILTKPPANKTSRPDLGGLFVIGWRDTSHESALRWVWLNPMVIDTVQDEFIASANITLHPPTCIYFHVGVFDHFPFYHQPTYQPDSHRAKPDGRKQASPSLGWDRAQIIPTGFIPNPISPTQRPSCQTRWKKTISKFQNHRCIYTIYDIYILIIGIYIIYINISMRFKQKKQSL